MTDEFDRQPDTVTFTLTSEVVHVVDLRTGEVKVEDNSAYASISEIDLYCDGEWAGGISKGEGFGDEDSVLVRQAAKCANLYVDDVGPRSSSGRTDMDPDVWLTLNEALSWYADDRIECAKYDDEEASWLPAYLESIDQAQGWLNDNEPTKETA